MNDTKICIIGASGFVGSAILKAFVEGNASAEIFVTENQSAVDAYPGIKKIKASLFEAPHVIEDIKPDIIIHSARISGRNYRFGGRKRAAYLGNRANRKIAHTVLKLDIRLLYISGSLMYGSHPGKRVTEDFPINPISYAIEYAKAERPFLKNINKGNIMICRPGWIFGPNSWFKFFFEDIIKQKNYVPQYAAGRNYMSIIHRNDLGRLVREYALKAPYSKVYNVLSPIGLQQKTFAKELASFYQKDIRVIPKKQLLHDYDQVTCDALTCDIPMATNYDTIMNAFNYEFTTVNDLLESV